MRRAGPCMGILAALTVACTTPVPPVTSQARRATVAAAESPALEPPARILVEPVPENQTQRLLQAAARVFTLCDAWNQIQDLREPRPHQLAELMKYVTTLDALLHSIDPDRTIIDRARSRAGDTVRMRLPPQVRAALTTELREVYAYHQRLAFLRAVEKNRRLPRGIADQTLDRWFIAFALGPYANADGFLESFAARNCALG